MVRKIFIASPLEVHFHFIERFASGESHRTEHPCAFGASPARKMLFIDPYQFAAHGPLARFSIWRRYDLVIEGAALVFFRVQRLRQRLLLPWRGFAQIATLRRHIVTELNILRSRR